MDVNLTDWLGTNLALLWVLIGLMLLTLEWLRRDLSLAMTAAGAAIAAAVALVVPHAWYVQLVIGVVAAFVGVLLVRPALLRAEKRRGDRPAT